MAITNRVEIGLQVEVAERPAALARRGKRGAGAGAEKTRAKAAHAAGMHETTYQRARDIVLAARAYPRLKPIADRMDNEEISINEAHRLMKEGLRIANLAATNGAGQSAPVWERPLPGMKKRTGLSAKTRLERVATALEGYAEALPAMHLRGEDVESVLLRIEKAASGLRSAARRRRKEQYRASDGDEDGQAVGATNESESES